MAALVSLQKPISGFLAIWMLGTTAASAAPAPAASSVDPLIALSVFGTAQSRAAVCSAGSSAAAAAGAAVAAQAAPGCVLPALDAPPPPPVSEAAPPPAVPAMAPATAGGIGILPLLVGLAAIAGFAAVILSDNDDDEINLPISP